MAGIAAAQGFAHPGGAGGTVMAVGDVEGGGGGEGGLDAGDGFVEPCWC